MKKFLISAIGLTALATSTAAQAQIIVQGTSAGRDCYNSVKHGNQGSPDAIKLCEGAMDDIRLSTRDLAATYINTAILHMRAGNYERADRYFLTAIEKKPKIPESYINRAANLIHQGEYLEAIESANKGIDMETDKMPEALYNRAMANHRLGDYKNAYKDLNEALTYRPDWPIALNALQNYQVETRPRNG